MSDELTTRRLRQWAHDDEVRRLRELCIQADESGDQAALREHLGELDSLRLRFPEFYPERSPYFPEIGKVIPFPRRPESGR